MEQREKYHEVIMMNVAKPRMLTVFIHDYALAGSNTFNPRTVPIEIFGHYTLEFVREMSDEHLGKSIRELLERLEAKKKEIENL